jgi:hypothetical protein
MTIQGIPVKDAIAHRDNCAKCQEHLRGGTAEDKWQIIKHILKVVPRCR